jgi:hypothetical protein
MALETRTKLEGYLSKKNLLGLFLGDFLASEDMGRSELCRRLDIPATQLTQWLNGHDPIPQLHIIRIKEVLDLNDKDFVALCYLNNIVLVRAHLEKLLTGGRKRRKAPDGLPISIDGLASYLSGGKSTMDAICRFSETMAEEDLYIYPNMKWPEALFGQIGTALHVAKDIDEFVKGEEGEIFDARNINLHLQYPFNYHVGFYLGKIDGLKLPNAPDLKSLLWESIHQASRALGSDDLQTNRIAQHATHLISRYDGPHDEGRIVRMRKGDLETQRMALFGRVYREEDGGDFERLMRPITTDAAFAQLVLEFDNMHYSGLTRYKSTTKKIPTKAFLRHLNGLGNEKTFVRNLSAARLNVFLERYETVIKESTAFIEEMTIARERIKTDNITEALVEKTLGAIDKLILASKKGS